MTFKFDLDYLPSSIEGWGLKISIVPKFTMVPSDREEGSLEVEKIYQVELVGLAYFLKGLFKILQGTLDLNFYLQDIHYLLLMFLSV